MAEIFRWAFIGMGTLGKKVAEEITASGRHQIVSVYVRNREKCAAFAAEYGALAAETAEQAMTAQGVDGVYLVTPHTSHYEYAMQALRLGKPVLCEKPVSTDAKKTAEMLALSEENGVYFTEGMWTWFSPVANKVKEWLDAGEYGEIKKIKLLYHVKSLKYAPRVGDPKLAGGALLDIGIYPVTYLYRLFGKPESITCQGRLRGGIDTGEDIRMNYPGGRSFLASASIIDNRGLEHMRIVGSKARTTLWNYHSADKVSIKRRGKRKETFKAFGGMLNEFDLVAEEIREGRTESRYVPHAATLGVMELLDECRRQMKLVYPFETENHG